jgi:enoyl-CoA hydratase
MAYTTLLTEQRGKAAIITINRPTVLNALNKDVLGELSVAVEQYRHDANTATIIITGAGEKAFAAGADIAEMPTLTRAQTLKMSNDTHKILYAIENNPKPIIAAINGFALGGGLELAMACHIRIASDNAKFGLPEIKLGLIPGYGGTQRLPRLVGTSRAFEMMFTGEMINAGQALQYGLVNQLYPQTELLAAAVAMAQKMEAFSPLSFKYMIESVNAERNGMDGYYTEADRFADIMVSADGREGTTAFVQKRKPTFTGK